MLEINRLISILWTPFITEIRSGDPVFFCFYSDWLTSAFLREGIQIQDPVKIINDAANSFLLVDNNEVHLLPEALQPIQNSFSAAIILVCQQVLAVEQMVSQQSGYTENAYFPRLRKMISDDLQDLSQNPFSFDDFEMIWRRLAQEIRSVVGSSESSITFRFGIEQGINKARSFPLSQALLSREDLNILARQIGVERLRKADSDNLWILLRSEKAQLKRRSQRLMSLAFLRDRIIEQTRAFAEKVDPMKFKFNEPTQRGAVNYEIRFYKDSVDWYTDEFRAYLIRNDTGERVDQESEIREELRRELNQKGFFVLPISSFGDSWVKLNRDLEIRPGDTFLIAGTRTEIDRAWKVISTLVRGLSQNTAKTSECFFGEDIVIHEVQWPINVSGELVVRSGGLSGRTRGTAQTMSEWMGGCPIDSRHEKFLRGHLPKQIKFDSEIIPISDATTINGKYISFDIFERSLEDLSTDQEYEFYFQNGKRKKIIVAVAKGDANDRMGFLFDDQGKISPVIDRITTAGAALIGFEEPTNVLPISLSAAGCAQILNDLISKNGKKLNLSEKTFVLNAIQFAAVPREVKQVIERFLLIDSFLSEKTLVSLGLSV